MWPSSNLTHFMAVKPTVEILCLHEIQKCPWVLSGCFERRQQNLWIFSKIQTNLHIFTLTTEWFATTDRNCSTTWKRVYYSLAVWRFKPILSAGLRFHSYLSGGLRLRNYRAIAENHKFSSRFSVFACFCGGYSNRVKRLRRLSGNFILLKLLSLTKDCLLGLDQVSKGFPLCPRSVLRGNLI